MHVISYAMGAVLRLRIDKKPTISCYASKTLVDAQLHYTTTKKELLEVIDNMHILLKF